MHHAWGQGALRGREGDQFTQDLPYTASNLREYNLRAYATVKIHISVMICFLNIDFQNLQEFDYLRLASVAHGKEACDS